MIRFAAPRPVEVGATRGRGVAASGSSAMWSMRRQQGERGGEVVAKPVISSWSTNSGRASIRFPSTWSTKNDLGSRSTQRAAVPKAFVDVLDGDLIHERNGRDQVVVP